MTSQAPGSQTRMRCRRPPAAMSNSRLSKRRRRGRCYFDADGFDENLVHEILSRQPVPDLLAAKKCCRSWNRIISTCKEFHALYDRKSNNHAMVIGLNSSTNSFPFFQISDKGRKHTRQWDLAFNPLIVGENSEWMLVGSYKSLLLFQEKEVIKFCVANPLTRKCRLIPELPSDFMVNEGKTWRMRSVHMIVSDIDKSLKLRVDKRLKLLVFVVSDSPYSCYSMVYDSLTNGWIEYNISQDPDLQFGRIAEGVCFNGKKAIQIVYPSLFSYDTETSVLEHQDIEFDDSAPAHQNIEFDAHQNIEFDESVLAQQNIEFDDSVLAHQNTESDAHQNIEFDASVPGLGIFEYQNNRYYLNARTLSDRSKAKMSKIRIWKEHSTGGKWILFKCINLVRVFRAPISCESVVCYDQERYISVFPTAGSWMILVDLHSNSFRILRVNPVTLTWKRNKNHNSRGSLRAFPIKPSFNCFLQQY